jgi:acetyl esterase/lipase
MDIASLFRPFLRRPGLLLGLVGALLSGCSPIRMLDRLTPAGDYRLDRDQAYGEHPRQRVDVYRPSGGGNGTVVVFFYGGAWRGGERADYRFVGESLTRHGITVVIPDYRVYPEATFPAFIDDGARVLRWVRETVASDGSERVFVMGHSAGAHIAALLALDPRYRQAPALAGFIGISGPYDFLPFAPRTAEIFAGTADLATTQPITFAGLGSPPALLFHGAEDRTVYTHNAENLSAALRRSGVPVRYVLYPDRGHIDIMLGLSSVLDGNGRLMAELLDFLKRP